MHLREKSTKINKIALNNYIYIYIYMYVCLDADCCIDLIEKQKVR